MDNVEQYEVNDFTQKFNNQFKFPYSSKLTSLMTWTPGENVMDYGCGPGTLGYKTILPHVERCPGSTLYSVDCSSKVIGYVQKRYPHPQIKYTVGDILDRFPLAESVKFDKIFAYHCLHHMSNVTKPLRGFNSILKPGGKLALLCFSERLWAFQVYRRICESEQWVGYMSGWESFYPMWASFPVGHAQEFFEKLLNETGYRLVHLEAPQLEVTVDNVDSYIEMLKAAFRGFNSVPKEMEAKLRIDIRRALMDLAGLPENSTSFIIPFEYVACIAEKICV